MAKQGGNCWKKLVFSLCLTFLLTCNTGEVTKYFSRNALGDMSYERQVERCWRMDSMVCLGCCLVTLKYFCKERDRLGKTAWAAWYGLRACLRLPAMINVEKWMEFIIDWIYQQMKSRNVGFCYVCLKQISKLLLS